MTRLLLELDLREAPTDPDPADPLGRFRARGRRLLRPTLRALHEAGDDRHVVGLVAKVGGSLPWVVMQDLRRAVTAFRSSGKPAVAWSDGFGEAGPGLAGYVLASSFEEIWLQPGGGVGALGVGLQTTFLRGALDKLGVQPEFEQRFEYKNAPDQLLRTEFSGPHREALEAVADSVYAEAVSAIAAARGMDEAQVRQLIDRGPMTASETREAGLVDRLGYRDEAYAAIRRRVGSEDGQQTSMLYADRWHPRRRPRPLAHRRGHVALVEIRGTIASGASRRSPLSARSGADTAISQLRAAREDDRARALLLRVDSPGGSAVASEAIWREVGLVRESGRPVIVSMGSVAASGGYYVACPADVIMAAPATLTGSIGVFGGKLVIGEALDRVGITTGFVQRGEQALALSSRRTFSEDERARFAATIDAIYADFVAKVAQGRSRSVEEIDQVARGRVWTGRDAVAAGLVDELGDLRAAADLARRRAGLGDHAPVLPALRIPPLARLGQARNSEDPRAQVGPLWPGLGELLGAAGLNAEAVLRMPPIDLR